MEQQEGVKIGNAVKVLTGLRHNSVAVVTDSSQLTADAVVKYSVKFSDGSTGSYFRFEVAPVKP